MAIKMHFNSEGANLGHMEFVRELQHGENNLSYLYKGPAGARYVVRQKNDISSIGSLTAERNMLSFLEAEGYAFAPKSMHFDPQRGVHVTSYIEGQDIRPFAFTDEQAMLFAAQLAALHSIPFENYAAWCRGRDIPVQEPEPFRETFRKFVLEPTKFVQEYCPDAALKQWTEKRLAECVKHADDHEEYPTTLSHGDLGGNMKWDGRNLTFIDWETARFLKVNELGYIFIHGQCSPKTQAVIKDEYALSMNFSPAARRRMEDEIAFNMEILRFDKVLWPAARYTELALRGDAGAARYRDMALNSLSEDQAAGSWRPKKDRVRNAPGDV